MTCQHCDKPVHCRGLCAAHYLAARRSGAIEVRATRGRWPVVGVCACGKAIHARGLCQACYRLMRRAELLASSSTCRECNKPHYGKGLCHTHYDRAYRAGNLSDRCIVCWRPRAVRDLCKFCYNAVKVPRKVHPVAPCSEEGCVREVHSSGLCRAHYLRAWRAQHRVQCDGHVAHRWDENKRCVRCGIKRRYQYRKETTT